MKRARAVHKRKQLSFLTPCGRPVWTVETAWAWKDVTCGSCLRILSGVQETRELMRDVLSHHTKKE